jgi:hypothetical protein
MAVAAIGLTPMFPVIEVDPVVEIPDFARTAKLPADPRFTAAGPAASAAIGPVKPNTKETINALTIEFLLNLFMCFI